MQVQDNQLQYLIQLCRAKNIPEEEITKILLENSKSDFLKELQTSFKESQVYENVPHRWKDYAVKYVEYVGTLMDPSKVYTTVKDEPHWPNPQVKKKEELKFKKELLNFVLIMKNKALKKYLTDSPLRSKDNTPKSLSKSVDSPIEKVKSLKEELESWDFKDDQEFTSKGPVSVVSPLNGQKVDLNKSSKVELGESPTTDVGKRVMEESKEDDSVPSKKIKKDEIERVSSVENDVQEEIKEGPDLQSLREKVLMSRRNSKKEENKESEKDDNERKDEKDEISLEEGEISSDAEPVKDQPAGLPHGNFNNYGNGNGKRGRKYEQNNRHRKDDWRERHQSGPSPGAMEKHRAVAPVNPGMASYLTYPASGNIHQSNNYIGAMPFFRPPVFAMGYSQQYQPPNPYMQIDSNALAKAQMLANMSQQQTQPIFPQMSGTRAGGPPMNRPMQYTNSNQTNFWMMNMPHINNGPGFAFAPGNVPQNGSFYSYAGRPTDAHLDTNIVYENPTSRE